MKQKLVRDIPDDVFSAIEQMANAASKNTEEYIRDLLVEKSQGPIIRERYAIKFYNSENGKGQIRRFSNDLNGVSPTYSNLDREESDAVEKATDLIRRNEQGDAAKAIWILKSVFENVFEIPA